MFAIELEEEKCRFIRTLLLAAAAIALGVNAVVLMTITVVVLFWENERVSALCVLSAVFLAAALLVARALSARLRQGPGFAGTLGELKKDRTCLLPRD